MHDKEKKFTICAQDVFAHDSRVILDPAQWYPTTYPTVDAIEQPEKNNIFGSGS
ncbi:hypothetical protein M378DRAFT_17744 [Amanita muscaria Koide BX008]|uniref:Uncharacterized protein n=1 Tax=Amanita muscaria (strain Koide BX008) TaxID=946122 RepID=A0A0C2SNV0_AMAMK|nr:hypothetical protein M378DRAFT_17744 [Amanita muscaria Koide BX008]